MTRILHVNKFAGLTGGVESVVGSLMQQQEAAGHDVGLFASEDLDEARFTPSPSGAVERARTAAAVLWNGQARAALRRRLLDARPDVVHFHSVYHQLSPSVLGVVAGTGAASVLSLHDYKTIAPCYVLLRDGRRCVECVGTSVAWPAVRHRCIKDSLAGSVVCTVEDLVHRRRYGRAPDLLTVPSQAALQLHLRHGVLPADKLRVTPWGFDPPGPAAEPAASRTVVYAGRVSVEKGVAVLVRAWRDLAPGPDWRLAIIGDGPQRDDVRRLVGADPSVELVGTLDRSAVVDRLRAAAAAVVPSQCEETFGLAALEAMATGLPVVASRIGALPELVGGEDTGLLVDPGDHAGWVRALERLTQDAALRSRLGAAAAERARTTYSAGRMAAGVDEVYAEARARSRSKSSS